MLDRSRVAELLVTHPGGKRHGSGYRVTSGAVLTAAHVIEDAESVVIRFEADLPSEWAVSAASWWVDPDTRSDLGVLLIEPGHDDHGVLPVSFGRIGHDAAVLDVQAVGFPRWKMRNRDGTVPAKGDGKRRYRDVHQAVGSVAVLSNWKEGTLEVAVSVPPAQGDDADVSPWEGMSGAALWAGDRIIGVVSRHHPEDGLGRLTAVRLDRALQLMPPTRRADLCNLLPLPQKCELLPDVLPESPTNIVATAYRAQVADIAPSKLLDRERELAELTNFCAGTAYYSWWQSEPWAGKSALLSSFVVSPPAGVEVVSFFITSRFAGLSDSDAFTDAVIEQLAALAGEPPQLMLDSRARHGHMLRLLEMGAARCEKTGRRLLLVVDGLDEDTSRSFGRGLPSIASLLPRQPLSHLLVLVSSRPHPELPPDVSSDHPLRSTVPRQLKASKYARDLEAAANEELGRILLSEGFHRDVLGLITASGGGLTRADLEELTVRPAFEFQNLFHSVFGRVLDTRGTPPTSVARSSDSVYIFAHETLRQVAEYQYGASLGVYRDRLHVWADTYRQRGWPADTPSYLLRGYPRILSAIGDTDRLVVLAADSARHRQMLERTGGDAQALGEITNAATLIARKSPVDLEKLLLLALARSEITQRNQHLPVGLPGVWVRLGRPARAIALANGITDPMRRFHALSDTVEALIIIGDERRAADLRNEIRKLRAEFPQIDFSPDSTAKKSDDTALQLDYSTAANRVLSIIPEPVFPQAEENDIALTQEALAHFSRHNALALINRCQQDDHNILTWICAAARLGNVKLVVDLLDHQGRRNGESVQGIRRRDNLTRQASAAAAQGGQWMAAEELARKCSKKMGVASFLMQVAHHAALARETTLALRLVTEAAEIDPPAAHSNKNSAIKKVVALMAATTGDTGPAYEILMKCPHVAGLDRTRLALAVLCNRRGEDELSDQIIASIPVRDRDTARSIVAFLAFRDGDISTAIRLGLDTRQEPVQASLLAHLSELDITADSIQRAEHHILARADGRVIEMLTALAQFAVLRHPEVAERLLDSAERLARGTDAVAGSPDALLGLATASASIGDFEVARELTAAIRQDRSHNKALTALAVAAARRGLLDSAENVIDSIEDEWPKIEARALVSHAAANIDWQWANKVARQIPADDWRIAWALAAVALGAHYSGNTDIASLLRNESEQHANHVRENDYRKSNALASVARATVVIRDLRAAEQIASSIPLVSTRSTALADVVAAARVDKDPADAHRILEYSASLARSLSREDQQAIALAAVAVATAVISGTRAAECLAEEIPTVSVKVTALAGIALATGPGQEPGEPNRMIERAIRMAFLLDADEGRTAALIACAEASRKLEDVPLRDSALAAVLIGEDWWRALPVIASMNPEAVRSAVRMVSTHAAIPAIPAIPRAGS